MLVRPGYRNARLGQKGLVGWYPFDGDYLDYSNAGINGNGTPTGTPIPIGGMGLNPRGRQRLAYKFDGSSSYVTCGNPNLTPVMSAMCWVLPSALAAAYNAVISHSDNTNYFQLFIKSTGKLAAYIFAAADVHIDPGVVSVPLNQWTHIAFTYGTGGGLATFVNGVLDGSTSPNGSMGGSVGSALAIGNDLANAGRVFNGAIDDVRIFNRTLQECEILAIYAEAFQPVPDIETIALMRHVGTTAAIFRKTAFRLGTRVGTRQQWIT